MPSFKQFFITCTLLLISVSSHAVELMKWERLPLAIPLHVGQERVIFIDRNVRVGVPASIKDHLRVQTANGTIYLRAEKPIAPTRIQFQDAETGELILLDIAATSASENSKALEPVRIVQGEVSAKHYGAVSGQQTTPETAQRNAQPRETPVPVVLTRYAAQNLYAPLRTVEPVKGIGRVNIRKDMNLTTLLPTLPVKATPLAAWKLEDYFVSAIKLQNTTRETITLDPRLLQGDFIAATFQHQTLGALGSAEDVTVVYIITRKNGLQHVLLPHISQFDAQATLRSASDEK